MANNLVVQLLLKTGTFSTDLKTARGQVQNFQKGCQTAGKSLTSFGQSLGINIGTLAKFGGAIGAAALAGKGLKSVIDSTQSSSDAFEGVIAGCKGVVDSFARSLATADFSNFRNGIWDIYDAAKAARDAIDDLNDAALGYSIISSENQAKFSSYRNDYLDLRSELKNAQTDDERNKIKSQMDALEEKIRDIVEDEKRQAQNFNYKNLNAIRTALHSDVLDIQTRYVTGALVMEAARIFNSENVIQEKKRIKAQANFIRQEANKFATDSKREQFLSNYDNQRVLILDALFEMAQDKIEAVAKEYVAGQNAITSAEAMDKMLKRLLKPETTSGNRSGSGKSEQLKEMEQSLTYWKRIADEEKRYRDAVIADTEAWNEHNDKLEEALQKVKEIDAHMQAMASRKNWITLPEVDNSGISKEATTNEGKPKLAGVAQPKELYTEVELQEKINKLLEKRKTLKEGSKELAENNKALAEYKTRLDALQDYGIDKVLNIKNDTLSSIQSLTSGLHTLSDAFSKLIGDTAGTKNAFSKFLDIVQVGINVFQAMTSIIQTVNSLQQIEANTATATAATEIAAEEAKALAKKKSTVQAEEAAQANMKEAVSGAAASQASIPGVGPLLAVAAVAAVLAAIVSAMTSIKSSSSKFANGGIVGGNSFTGDRVTANVNSGEMVLTRAQQANLFRLANGVGTTGGNQVEFHISGTDLVGVLNNNNRKNRLVR